MGKKYLYLLIAIIVLIIIVISIIQAPTQEAIQPDQTQEATGLDEEKLLNDSIEENLPEQVTEEVVGLEEIEEGLTKEIDAFLGEFENIEEDLEIDDSALDSLDDELLNISE